MEVAAEYAALIPTIAARLKRYNSSRDALILVNGLVNAQVSKLRAVALICVGQCCMEVYHHHSNR